MPALQRLSSTSSSTEYELNKEHLYDSKGNELPLLKFLRVRQEVTKGVKYVQSPVVSQSVDTWLFRNYVNGNFLMDLELED